jgi:threonine aldolase
MTTGEAMARVDMRSDTVTRPSPAMRQAIATAEVGDDVFGDDPTVLRLQDMAAERLGKEAAIFTPSGTMANQIAIRIQTQPGDEILVEGGAHPFNYEAGGPAMISGVTTRTLAGINGILNPSEVAACFRPSDPHFAPLRLVSAEDPANRGGGTPYPLDVLDEIGKISHARGASTHLDGARLFNAVVATGIAAARRARAYDTVSICLSKGLGAPVGSLLCGPKPLIDRALWVRKALGGGMRQAGILAAAGVYALDHNIERLADDHRRAQALASGLSAAGYAAGKPETNMVYVEVKDGPMAQAALSEHNVHCVSVGPTTLRLVTHLDIDDAGVTAAIHAFSVLSDELLA